MWDSSATSHSSLHFSQPPEVEAGLSLPRSVSEVPSLTSEDITVMKVQLARIQSDLSGIPANFDTPGMQLTAIHQNASGQILLRSGRPSVKERSILTVPGNVLLSDEMKKAFLSNVYFGVPYSRKREPRLPLAGVFRAVAFCGNYFEIESDEDGKRIMPIPKTLTDGMVLQIIRMLLPEDGEYKMKSDVTPAPAEDAQKRVGVWIQEHFSNW